MEPLISPWPDPSIVFKCLLHRSHPGHPPQRAPAQPSLSISTTSCSARPPLMAAWYLVQSPLLDGWMRPPPNQFTAVAPGLSTGPAQSGAQYRPIDHGLDAPTL